MAFGDLLSPQLSGAANSITNPFSATGAGTTVAVGDLIVAVLGEQTSLTVTACGDNLHGASTYTAVNAGTDGTSITGRCFYKVVTTAGSLTSVNFVTTASADNVAAVAAAFTGPFTSSPLDAAPANNNNTDNASPFTCPATGTLAQATELVIAWMTGQSNATWLATSPLLKAVQVVSQSVADTILGYKVVSSTTTTSPEFTGTNPTASVQGTASFKADLNQTLTPSLFDDTDSILAPTITVGPVNLSPSLYTDPESFSAPTISATYSLTPSLYDDADTVFAPTVSSTVTFSPALYSDADSIFAPTISGGGGASGGYKSLLGFWGGGYSAPAAAAGYKSYFGFWSGGWTAVVTGAQTLTPSLYTDTDSFFAPAVTTTYSLTPALYTDTDSFFVPTITTSYSLAPSLYIDADSIFAPTITVGVVTLTPSLYTDTDSFFVPTITAGGQIAPDLYTDSETFFAPSITTGAVTLTPSLYTDTETFFAPSVSKNVAPSFYSDTDAFFAPTITKTYSIAPAFYIDNETFFVPTVSSGASLISPSLVSDSDSFFVPLFTQGIVTQIVVTISANEAIVALRADEAIINISALDTAITLTAVE